MPSALTYPGVYVEEIASGVRTITGVATSITAFIGRSRLGPVNQATTINSFGDFERNFGGLWEKGTLGFAVRDFYLNGGSQAIIVRLAGTGAAAAALAVSGINFVAANEGEWGQALRLQIDLDVTDAKAASMGLTKADLFNLTVKNTAGGASERFANVTIKANHARNITKVLEAESNLVRVSSLPADITAVGAAKTALDAAAATLASAEAAFVAAQNATPPVQATINAALTARDTAKTNRDAAQMALNSATTDKITIAEATLTAAVADLKAKEAALVTAQSATPQVPADITAATAARDTSKSALTAAQNSLSTATTEASGNNGDKLTMAHFLPANGETEKKGLHALEQADIFNLLCIPPYTADLAADEGNTEPDIVGAAAAYCEKRRAMLIVDPPGAWNSKTKAVNGIRNTAVDEVGTRSRNAAIFFPRLRQSNPLADNQPGNFAPCGAAAGIFARTDTTRGVWKAPAGLEAKLIGVPQLTVPLTDAENGELNPLGVNCLRAMPAAGRVVWGSRTLEGDDRVGSEWKYIPVRRTALYIEESLYRGTQWAVFEPNDEPLWAQLRLNIGAFMNNLFRQGAFQGKTSREAYFVKCDKETTTQNDINLGIVNIHVGFAPLKPAEFVVLKIQQITGDIQT